MLHCVRDCILIVTHSAMCHNYASRRSRTRDTVTVKLTVCVCVCLSVSVYVCVYSSCNSQRLQCDEN